MRARHRDDEDSREVRELLAPVLALLLAGTVSVVMESTPGRLAVHALSEASRGSAHTVRSQLEEQPASLLRREAAGVLREASSEVREQLRSVRQELQNAFRVFRRSRGGLNHVMPMLSVPIRLSETEVAPLPHPTSIDSQRRLARVTGDCA